MSNIVTINGIEYDTRNEDDRLYLNSIGYFDKQTNFDIEWWNVPVCTSFINKKKSEEEFMDMKAVLLFSYFSERKSEEVCEMLGIDISEMEEHRFLYRNFLNDNIEKFEELSNWKKNNIFKQINKLTKANNRVFEVDYTSDGKIYYKIMPYINKENKLSKSGTFVTIESDIVEFLINSTNANVIKVYCFLKWFLIDSKHYETTGEIKYIKKKIDRKFILRQIGLNENSSKMAKKISNDIEELLVMTGLIKRTLQCQQEFGQTKSCYYYEIISHDEWIKYRKEIRKNGHV